MSIESALYSYLVAQSEITTLASTRVSAGARPQNETFPYIVFGRDGSRHLNGWSGAAGMVQRSMEFVSYAETYVEAIALGDALRDVLDNYNGVMGTEFIDSCLLEGTDAVFEERRQDGGESYIYGDRKVFSIWHTETVPSNP